MINEKTGEKGSKKTKGGVKMKKLLLGLMVVGFVGLMAGAGEAATDTNDIDLYVTPVVETSLTVSPTYYDFGDVDVGVSTGSVSALVLTNDGDIEITIKKEITSDDGWYITRSSSAEDGFDLWAMVSVDQPNHAAFENTFASFSKTGLGVENILPDTSGTQISMSKGETNNMWFRMDMPYAVTESREQKIEIQLTATSN